MSAERNSQIQTGNFQKEIHCESERYQLMHIYSIILALVYPIGIPSMYATLLYRDRHEVYPDLKEHGFWSMFSSSHPSWNSLKDEEEEHEALSADHPLAFLVSAYKPRAFWFEIVECFRRIVLSRYGFVLWG